MHQTIHSDQKTIRAQLLDGSGDTTRQLEPLAYGPLQAARVLGISRGSLYELLASGLPSFKLGRRRLIRRSDLIAFMEHALAASAESQTSNSEQRGA